MPLRLKKRRSPIMGGLVVVLLVAAASHGGAADRPAFAPPKLIAIPGGPFITGSDRAEREAAYRLDEAAYGHSRTRQWKWYENERPRGKATVPAFEITKDLDHQRPVLGVRQGNRAPRSRCRRRNLARLQADSSLQADPQIRLARRPSACRPARPPGRHGLARRRGGLRQVAVGQDRPHMAPAHRARVGESGTGDRRTPLSLG